MRIDGKTLVEIANTLGISLSTASRWNRLFKSDILAVQNKQVENLRNKIIDRYNSYFDFLDSQLERMKTEIGLHKEIAMTYPDLIDYTIKILEAQNRINIFRKFSYKPPAPDFPPEIENTPPEETAVNIEDNSPEENSPPDDGSPRKHIASDNEKNRA